MSSRKGRWSPSFKRSSSPASASKSKASKLSTGSFKGRFSSHYGTTSKSGSTTSSEAGEVSATAIGGHHGHVDGAAAAAHAASALASAHASFSRKPVISLTSSTGSSSCILSSQDEDSSTSDHSSRSSSGLNRIASRASDIQTYASRYLDSIRTKSWTSTGGSNKSRSSPSRSDSPSNSSSHHHHSGIPYLLTFRQHQQHPSVQAAIASNLQPLLRPSHSSTPSPPPTSSSSLPSRKTSDSRSFRSILVCFKIKNWQLGLGIRSAVNFLKPWIIIQDTRKLNFMCPIPSLLVLDTYILLKT